MPYTDDELQAAALALREQYPDDDDFAEVMQRLEAVVHQEEADAQDGEAGPPPRNGPA